MSVEVFDTSAQLYQDKYSDVSLYAPSLDIFCEKLPLNANLLDIACGPGNLARYLLDKQPDFQVLGIDLAPGMLTLARKLNPEAEFRILDARHILQINQRFDGILCGFGLPYLSKEEAIVLIGDAAKILHPKGLLYLSTMEDDYSKSSMKTSASTGQSLFMHFHESGYLTDALEANGLTVNNVQRISSDSTAGPVTDLILVASTSF